MAGAGVGTEGTNFMFSIRENNWLGKGVRVDTAFSISEERISGNIAVTDPNYNFSGNSVSTALNVSATDRTGTTGFKSQKSGFSLGTSFEQYEDVYVSPSLSLNHEDIEAESTASDSIKKMEGTYLNSDFTYGILLDKRNQTFQTTDGYSASFYQSLPIIQDSSSISNSFFVNNWHEFSENVIGSLKFQLKSVHGIDDDVRLTNRLFIPTKRLRGFESGKVGPKDGNDWVGGNYVYGLSAEAQLPNLLPESYNTDFSVYLDTANVWGVDYSNTINNSSKLRSSIGVAANVFTPVGPLSWTFSQNLTKASSDVTETISFQLGTSF